MERNKADPKKEVPTSNYYLKKYDSKLNMVGFYDM